MAGEVIGIVGMAALRRDINRMATDQSGPLYQAIKAAGKSVAEPVASATRAALPVDQRGPGGRLAGTVRTSGTRTGAAVRMGYKSVPYAGWIEFGGTRPDGSSREYVSSGRYLFPAARAEASTAAQLYADAIARILNSPAVWTNTTNDGSQVHD
jgi:hypothetical protein